MQVISLIYIIMKYNTFFKYNLQFQDKISLNYAQEAIVYQTRYNTAHPQHRIWRHLLYQRTFYFFQNGKLLSVRVELVRFRYAGTNRTFTFYGTLFCAYSHFAAEFIRRAVSESHIDDSPISLSVSLETLRYWKNWLVTGRVPSPGFPKDTRP